MGEIAFQAAADDEAVAKKMTTFFTERLGFYLKEAKGVAYDVVNAVLATKANAVHDVVSRAQAVTAARGSEDFAAVANSFKRMKNILSQAGEKGFTADGEVSESQMVDAAELALHSKAATLASRIATMGESQYKEALEAVATLRPQVDAFFGAVMVLTPDETLRANRLALLRKVLHDFSGIADFSEIVMSA